MHTTPSNSLFTFSGDVLKSFGKGFQFSENLMNDHDAHMMTMMTMMMTTTTTTMMTMMMMMMMMMMMVKA